MPERWTEERIKSYFKEHYGDRGVLLFIGEYQWAVLPRDSDKWVFVDPEHERASAHDTLEGAVREFLGQWYSDVRILRCGPESSCATEMGADGCDVELISTSGEKEVRGVCTIY